MYLLVTVAALFLALGAAPSQTAGAPPAQQPPVAAPPTEETLRIQRLEADLKDRQRRVEFDTIDLPTRERLLREIINYCIELGRDYTPYQLKLKEVQAELKKQGTAADLMRRREKANALAKARAIEAMSAVPPRWSEASELLRKANILVKNDPETLALKEKADRKLREQLTYRVTLGSLVGLASTGLVVAGVTAFRKRSRTGGVRVRRLEMIEGPQPGEIFQLEKEITTLGALAVESDWAIPDPSHRISRRHCDIARSGRHYFLTDNSSNGTFINGKQAPKGEPVLLRKGDRIALTDDILLRFR